MDTDERRKDRIEERVDLEDLHEHLEKYDLIPIRLVRQGGRFVLICEVRPDFGAAEATDD